MKKQIFLVIVFLLICKVFADPSAFQKKVDISPADLQYSELKKENIEVWIRYSSEIGTFGSGLEKTQKILESVKFYLKKNGNMIYVGKVDKDGLFDKNNTLLCSTKAGTSKVLGISDTTLTTPLAPNIVIKRADGKVKETDVFVLICFDLKELNIKEYKPVLD
jgi:hypothetical protein